MSRFIVKQDETDELFVLIPNMYDNYMTVLVDDTSYLLAERLSEPEYHWLDVNTLRIQGIELHEPS